MKTSVHAAFNLDGITLQLSAIHPIRQVKPMDNAWGKYRSMLASIREVGVIEPLIVHPQKGSRGIYLLLDGHMRLKARSNLAGRKCSASWPTMTTRSPTTTRSTGYP